MSGQHALHFLLVYPPAGDQVARNFSVPSTKSIADAMPESNCESEPQILVRLMLTLGSSLAP